MRYGIVTALILVAVPVGLPAVAQVVGDGFDCPGPDGGVFVTVGRVETLSGMTGRAQAPDPVIAHLYLENAMDFVEHAAFEVSALADCTPDPDTPFDDVAFDEALGAYLTAARTGTPRIFTQSPAEAFAIALQGN